MEKDIQAQTPLAVKFKLQPGDSRYVRYVEENHHQSLRKKSFNPNYRDHPNELKYSPAECLMLDIMHIPAPAMGSMKYKYVRTGANPGPLALRECCIINWFTK